jgi:hypothetical protein
LDGDTGESPARVSVDWNGIRAHESVERPGPTLGGAS